MSTQIDFTILIQLTKEKGNKQIYSYFNLLISELNDYLGLQLNNKKIQIRLVSDGDHENKRKSNVLDLGVKRIYENNNLLIDIYEIDQGFLPFILLREAYYFFVPKEIKKNDMIKVFINQILENHLEKAEGFKKWHKLIRDALVDRDFLIAQLDKLQKFFKIEPSEEHESPIQFFFREIYENALIIGNRSIISFYDELFEKYIYKTSKSLYNEEIVKTLVILTKLFFKNKRYVYITDYQNLYKEFITNSDFSLKRFNENLLWINNCTSIAPSYNIVYDAIGRKPIFCELIFNPLIERYRIKKLLTNFPFMEAPRIIENSFAIKVVIAFRLPTIYLKDILSYFNKLKTRGYLISKHVYLYKAVKNFLNLNYYLDISYTSKIIDPSLKSYKTENEVEHEIEFPLEPSIHPLTIFKDAILDRIANLSVTGLTFDKRVETLNSIKDDIENEYRKQLAFITNFKENFENLLKSHQMTQEFLILLENNQKQGFFFLREFLYLILKLSNLIEKILTENPKINNISKLRIFLHDNSISPIIEENLPLQDKNVKSVYFNKILPKYFQFLNKYKQEIKKIRLYYNIINSSYNLKIFNISTITKIIRNPDLISDINRKKEERLKKAFKLTKSYKITNQKIESTIDEFLTHNPPIIVPMLLNTITTSQFAKYYPGTFLRNTPETRKKLERFKSYFPRVFLTDAIDIDTKEELIHLLPYLVNFKEKDQYISMLYNTFNEDLIATRRNFWRGIIRISEIKAKDFYDFHNNQFFYTKDLFEQFFIFTQETLGTDKLEAYDKENVSLIPNLFWASNSNMEKLINNVKIRLSHQKNDYNLSNIKLLANFCMNLELFLLNQDKFVETKSAEFFRSYINSIKFLPSFKKFGLGQYYLYLCPFDWDDIDLKLVLINTFQNVKYPAQIDPNQPLFIKYVFPYRTPNSSYINWLIKSKKAIRESSLFFIKRVYIITHFDHSLSSSGWHYSSNRFKIHLQNVLLNPSYTPNKQNIREFDIEGSSNSGVCGIETPEFEALTQIYNWQSVDIKSFLGTNKYSIINSIISLLKKNLISPYINLKNLGFQDKITLILPNVKTELKDKIVAIFSYFNVSRIYETEGDFYIYGFQEQRSFETGYMIEIWFPKCELDEFFDVFDLLFEYLEIKHFLILTDLVKGEILIKNVFGDLDILKEYNPLFNLKWNKKDKIWMNHKLFTKEFEPIYPNLIPKD